MGAVPFQDAKWALLGKRVKQLRGKGGKPLAAPRSFWVNVDSSLVDGEVAAARTWGDHLAAALAKP